MNVASRKTNLSERCRWYPPPATHLPILSYGLQGELVNVGRRFRVAEDCGNLGPEECLRKLIPPFPVIEVHLSIGTSNLTALISNKIHSSGERETSSPDVHVTPTNAGTKFTDFGSKFTLDTDR